MKQITKRCSYPYITKPHQILAKIMWQKSIADSQRELDKHRKYIDTLRREFDETVKKNREIAQKHKTNYLKFSADKYNLDPNLIARLPEQIKKDSAKLVGYIPSNIKNTDWFLTKFNSFNFTNSKKCNIPDDIFDVLHKMGYSSNQLNRIKIIQQKTDIFYTEYDKEKHIATIHFNENKTSIGDAISFAHECGHAFEYMRLDKLNSRQLHNWYRHEKSAITLEYEVGRQLKDGFIFLISAMLNFFRNSYFEYLIYVNNHDNYDTAFAQASNAVLVGAKQTKNELYLFDSFLYNWPGYTTLYTTIYLDIVENWMKNKPNPTYSTTKQSMALPHNNLSNTSTHATAWANDVSGNIVTLRSSNHPKLLS